VLNAIYYALFGSQGVSQEEYNTRLTSTINDRAHDEGRRECSIELTIEDETEVVTICVVWIYDSAKKLIRENRKIYILNRQTNTKKETFTTNEEYFDFINRRIPFDVAPFFIFDGEKIQDLVAKQDQKLMKDSIQKIVSLELYKSLVDDLGKIESSLERKLSTSKLDRELSSYLNEINEAQRIIDDTQNKLKPIDIQIQELEQEQNRISQEKRRKLVQNTNSNIQIEKNLTEYTTKLKRIEKDLESFAKEGLSQILLSSSIQKLKNGQKGSAGSAPKCKICSI
jgi:DNA sulfur modification protein DndD